MTNLANNLSCLTCRICLEKGKHTIDLFPSPSDQSVNILNIISECFGITIVYNKYLPSSICDYCIEDLTVASKFRKKCLSSEEKLSILIKNNNETLFENNIVSIDRKHIDNPVDILKQCDKSNYVVKECNESSEVQEKSIKKLLKCKDCNKSLKSELSLLKHNEIMHEKRKHVGKVTGFGANRQYNCTKCSYATPHSQTLINHMRRHNGERPYHCDCGKSFTQSSSLAAHRKTHSAITYYTCNICGKQFKHAFSLKTHLYVHEIGQFSCTICKKLLKSKQSHQAHMQRHYNIYNYSCEDCGGTFVTCSELLNHRKNHNLEKNMECHICGYKTHVKKYLIVHLKRHGGEKSYKCELCTLSFYTKSDLQRHKRVHSREKPFTCPTCGQRFTHSPSLNKHMQSVHGIEYKWADVKWNETRKLKLVVVSEKGDGKKHNKINKDYSRVLFKYYKFIHFIYSTSLTLN